MNLIARKKGFDYCFNDYSDWKEINDPDFQKLKNNYIHSAQKLEQYIRIKSGEILENESTFILCFCLKDEYGPIYKDIPVWDKMNIMEHIRKMINDYLTQRWNQELESEADNNELFLEIACELLEDGYYCNNNLEYEDCESGIKHELVTMFAIDRRPIGDFYWY